MFQLAQSSMYSLLIRFPFSVTTSFFQHFFFRQIPNAQLFQFVAVIVMHSFRRIGAVFNLLRPNVDISSSFLPPRYCDVQLSPQPLQAGFCEMICCSTLIPVNRE